MNHPTTTRQTPIEVHDGEEERKEGELVDEFLVNFFLYIIFP